MRHIKKHYLGGADLMAEMQLFFEDPERVVRWFNIPPLVVSCFAMLIILTIIWMAHNYFSNPIDDTGAIREKYKQLKGRLNNLIAFLGIAVSGTIIGSGLQRQLFLSVVNGGEMLYPIEFVYSFGFVFAMILFLLYVPSFLFLQEKARSCLQNSMVASADKDENITDSILKEHLMENLKVALSISLPIISSVVQNLFFTFE